MAEKKVSIGVHFWVPGNIHNPAGMPEVESNQAYVEARDTRLAAGPANQVLFIVENFLSDTRGRFKLEKEWDGHIIQTELYTPKPKGMSFRQAREYILFNYPADEYEFWGTELYVDGARAQKPTWGCVKGALDNLKLPNSKIDVSSCWINVLPDGIDPNASLLEIGLRTLARRFSPARILKAAAGKK